MGRKKKSPSPKTPEKKKAAKKKEVEVEFVSCHQCHRRHPEADAIKCTKDKCVLKYCFSCLKSNYKETVPKKGLSTWTCLRCRKICSCSDCRKNFTLQRDLEDLMAENLSLRKRNEELHAKVLSLEKDHEFFKEMILIANRKVERLEQQQEWRERLRLESEELEKQRKADLARPRAEEAAEEALIAAAAEAKRKRELEREEALQKTVRDLEMKLDEAENLRKELHNKIVELKGNIRVFVRVRPMLPCDGGIDFAVSYPTSLEFAGRGIELNVNGQKKLFAFDKVFDHKASQEEVFMEISQLVQSALDGFKVCIFAYGQTGSGKSYTMIGRPEPSLQKGLIPRSLEQIFQTSQALAAQGWKYKMQACMLEIYNEIIIDLLASGKERGKLKHEISHDAEGTTYVSDITIVDVCSIGQASSLFQKANDSRSVGATNMNEQSSRSHLVFILRINGVNESTGQQVQGVLNLIDLAGSERLSRTGATGERLKETQAINKSLSSLGDVICALENKAEHIPFRNSKLTFLLQPCLGGHSKTLMFVNVSPDPSSILETSSSLKFAEKVNACEIGNRRRQDVGGSVQSAHKKDRQGDAAYHHQNNQPTPSYQQTPKPTQKLKQTQYYPQTPRPSVNTRYKQQQPTTFIPAQIPPVSAAGLTSQLQTQPALRIFVPAPTVETADVSNVPANQRPVISTLTRLFTETSGASCNSVAEQAKKQEIDDNSKKLGMLFTKLNSSDISKNASEKLVQLCQALDRGDFPTALEIQSALTTSDWDECSFWLATLKRMIKIRQTTR